MEEVALAVELGGVGGVGGMVVAVSVTAALGKTAVADSRETTAIGLGGSATVRSGWAITTGLGGVSVVEPGRILAAKLTGTSAEELAAASVAEFVEAECEGAMEGTTGGAAEGGVSAVSIVRFLNKLFKLLHSLRRDFPSRSGQSIALSTWSEKFSTLLTYCNVWVL